MFVSPNKRKSPIAWLRKAAITYGFCKTNPAAAVTMQKEEVKPKDVLDDDEFERLLVELLRRRHTRACDLLFSGPDDPVMLELVQASGGVLSDLLWLVSEGRL